jgi:fatty acid desaturase
LISYRPARNGYGFFEQQDQAHRQTRKLLFLFLLAVIAIVITVNVSLALIWSWGFGGAHGSVAPAYPRGFFLVNTFVTLLFIAGEPCLKPGACATEAMRLPKWLAADWLCHRRPMCGSVAY